MGDLPNTSEDVQDMMREKIRNQAQRLRILEQYKVLCESRISELCPLHPLPVKIEHLGTHEEQELVVELSQAKAQIERLQKELFSTKVQVPLGDNYTLPPPSTDLTLAQLRELYSVLYHQHYKVLKENKQLEESLKAEIQLSEEQRTYIEVLKQSIEVNSYSGHEFKDTLKSLEEPQTTSKEEYKSEDFKSEENIQSWEDRQKTDKCLKDAAEALKFAEEEVIRLEDQNKDFEQDLAKYKNQLQSKTQEVDILKENYKKALKDIDQATQLLEKSEKEYKEVKENLENTSKRFEELEVEYKQLENFNENLEKKVQKLSNELETCTKLLETFKKKTENGKGEIDGLKILTSSFEAKIQVLTENLKELEYKHKILTNKYESQEAENKEIRNLNYSYEIKLKMLNESLLAFERNYKNLEKVNEELKQTRKEIKKETDSFQEQLRESQQYNEKLKLECEALKEKNGNLSKKFQDLEIVSGKNSKDFNKKENLFRGEIENLRDQVEKTLSDYEKLQRTSKDTEKLLEKEKTSKIKLSEDLSKLKKDFEDSDSSKNFLLMTQKTQENSFLTLQTENNSLKAQKKELLTQLTGSNQRKIILEEENTALRSLSAHLSSFKSQFDESLRFSSIFCSSFGSVLLNSSCFSSLISDSFKEILQKNNKSFELPLNDWLDSFATEFELLIRNSANTKDNLSFISSQLQSKNLRLQELNDQLTETSEFEQKLRSEIEDCRSEIQKKNLEIEILTSKIQYISTEFEHTKENFIRIKGDYEKMQETANFSSTKILKLKRALDEEFSTRKKLNSELIALQQEKNLLNKVLVRLEKLVTEEDLNVTYEDILKENLNSSMNNRSALISPVSGVKSFSYDFQVRNSMMFE